MTSLVGTLTEFHSNTDDIEVYIGKVEQFFIANDIQSEIRKAAILLTCIGNETYKLLQDLCIPKCINECSYNELVNLLKNQLQPRRSIFAERFKFHKAKQGEFESIAEYTAKLKHLAQYCKFESYLDTALRDQFIAGLHNSQILDRLFTEPETLTFARAIEIATIIEVAKQHRKDIEKQNESHKNNVFMIGHSSKQSQVQSRSSNNREGNKSTAESCTCCGRRNHTKNQCKYKDYKCNNCGRKGHLVKLCRSKKSEPQAKQEMQSSRNVRSIKPTVHTMESQDETQKLQELTLFNVIKDNQQNSVTSIEPILVTVQVNDKPVIFEVDSGATYTIMSKTTYNTVWPNNPPKLQKSQIVLRLWNNQRLNVEGTLSVDVTYNKTRAKNLPLLVVDSGNRSLLGRNWFKELGIAIGGVHGITQPTDWTMQYPDLFEKQLGSAKISPITLTLKQDAQPVFCRARQVPLPLKTKVEAALDQMVKEGTLEPVESSQWATPIVPVLKRDGSLRICIDYRATVNPAIQPNIYPMPIIQDVIASLSGGIIFSHLDMAQAYLQLPVDQSTSELLTVNTHKGLFTVKRLPFGLSASPAIFQRFMETLLSGIPGIAVYLDDIVVSGKTMQEHDTAMTEVLQRMQNAGLKLKKEKCAFNMNCITFLGFIISKDGVTPTKEKIEAIQNAPLPRNKRELQSFLGLVNFYNAFIKNKAHIAEPLHRLLDSKKQWYFGNRELESFNKLKEALQSPEVLTHYDQDKDIYLTCDASPVGIGAVLSHKDVNELDRPIAYASRTLSQAERNYSQTDKEGLAVIFGLKKFNRYIAGRHVTIITDHKPLVGLFNPKKQMPTMISPRMLRWSLMLSAYSYSLIYKPGSHLGNADGLSRLPLDNDKTEFPDPADVALLEADDLPIDSKQIQFHTQKDPILTKVIQWLREPQNKTLNEDPRIAPFKRRSNELSIQAGCLLLGNRVVIPQILRLQVLQELHSQHPGIVVSKMVARAYVWWPNIDKDIESMVNTCTVCQQTRALPPKEKDNLTWSTTTKKWSRIHIDIAGPYAKKQYFLIVVDSYTKWLEVESLSSSTAQDIIDKLRRIFSTHGLPDTLVSDNAKAFTGEEFGLFLRKNGIHHILTPPYHPASNGQAERYVQTTKTALRRLPSDVDIDTHLARFLFKQRTMPNVTTGIAPAELLFGRKIKTPLDLMVPQTQKPALSPAAVKRSFARNESVYMRVFKGKTKWLPAEIIEVRGHRVYQLLTPDGKKHVRHVDHLRKRVTPS